MNGRPTAGPLLADPGAPKRHAGFNVDEAPPAHWFNWLLKNIGEWIEFLNLGGTDELTYANARTRTVLIPAYNGVGSPAGEYITNDDGTVDSETTNGTWRIPFVIPDGATLTGVKVAGNSATATLKVFKKTWSNKAAGSLAYVTAQLGTTQTFAGTAGGSVASVSGLSDVADAANKTYLVTLTTSSVSDSYQYVEVTFTETRASGHF